MRLNLLTQFLLLCNDANMENLKANNISAGLAKKILYLLTIFVIILFGSYLRIKLYLIDRPLWHDEILYSYSLLTKNFIQLWGPLANYQKAGPLFTSLVFILTKIFGYSTYTLRFIPLITGVGSLLLFHLLVSQIYKNPLAVIFANLLFAVNSALIFYSQEFKPYSTDVFIILLICLTYFKIDFKILSIKQVVLYSIAAFLCVLISFPSMFAFAALAISNILKKDKKVAINTIILMAFVLMGALFLSEVFYSVKANELYNTRAYWNDGLLTFSIQSFKVLFYRLYKYVFLLTPDFKTHYLFSIVGFFFLLMQKNKLFYLMLGMFGFSLIASFLKLYPIYERCALFLIPFLIIIVSKPLDTNFRLKFLNVVIPIVLAQYFYFNTTIYSYNHPIQAAIYINCGTFASKMNEMVTYFIQEYSNTDKLYVPREFVSILANVEKVTNSTKHIDITGKYSHSYFWTAKEQAKFKRIFDKKSTSWIYTFVYKENGPFIENTLKEENVKYKLLTDGYIALYHVKK